ncbi:hypothetical protein LTR56_003061 [Elasticomyces elasticus]|nr:hypothetical protein LTR56_003061 [Elasticomyces elasticus]KAK3662123.1 hypothetical protein LTR22_007096 [Elasticomyces elasticus]KAK4927514.1 hypothetical protein LTR49_005654 [Elasticomyces elasticus]KAK5749768.1 hypothetical protein LTS12_020196 [Elasticomyces elasticus]
MDDQPKTLEGLKQTMEDARKRQTARKAAKPNMPNEIDIMDPYTLYVAACDPPSHQSEILETAIKKVQAIPELIQSKRMGNPNDAFMYCLPKGMKNPITADHAEFEGKLTVDRTEKTIYFDSLITAKFKAELGFDIRTADVGRFLGQDF